MWNESFGKEIARLSNSGKETERNRGEEEKIVAEIDER